MHNTSIKLPKNKCYMLTVTIQLKPKLKPNLKFSKITIILFEL